MHKLAETWLGRRKMVGLLVESMYTLFDTLLVGVMVSITKWFAWLCKTEHVIM